MKAARHIDTGLRGEALASEYLAARGYRTVAQRWRDPSGGIGALRTDIDLVVLSPDGIYHFVEVKTRTGVQSRDFAPEAAVTEAKSRRMAQAAERYMAVMRLEGEIAVDLVAVTLDGGGGESGISYYPNIVR